VRCPSHRESGLAGFHAAFSKAELPQHAADASEEAVATGVQISNIGNLQ
jgi:hypothetical protein